MDMDRDRVMAAAEAYAAATERCEAAWAAQQAAAVAHEAAIEATHTAQGDRNGARRALERAIEGKPQDDAGSA